jgi:hypothetical protein
MRLGRSTEGGRTDEKNREAREMMGDDGKQHNRNHVVPMMSGSRRIPMISDYGTSS